MVRSVLLYETSRGQECVTVSRAMSEAGVISCVCLSFLLNSGQDKFAQIASLNSAHQTQVNPLTWIQKLSCSENELCVPRLQNATGGQLGPAMENMQGSKEPKMERIRSR